MKKYDGTKESLEDKSHKPKTRHQNHIQIKNKMDKELCKEKSRITLCELWAKLRREKGYTKKITSLYRVMKRLNIKFYKRNEYKNTSKKET